MRSVLVLVVLVLVGCYSNQGELAYLKGYKRGVEENAKKLKQFPMADIFPQTEADEAYAKGYSDGFREVYKALEKREYLETLRVEVNNLMSGSERLRYDNTFNSVSYILNKACVKCHNPKLARANLDLTSYEKITGEYVYESKHKSRAVVPYQPEKSSLYTMLIEKENDDNCPPKGGLLEKRKVEAIYNWIKSGAKP